MPKKRTPSVARNPVDFSLQNEGSIFLLRPLTTCARSWTRDFLPSDALHFGPSIVVEHRYIADIVNGALLDGLTFQKTRILRKAPRICCVLGCHKTATIKRLTVPTLLDESLGLSPSTLYYCASHAPKEE
jgi:hypothetical protein